MVSQTFQWLETFEIGLLEIGSPASDQPRADQKGLERHL